MKRILGASLIVVLAGCTNAADADPSTTTGVQSTTSIFESPTQASTKPAEVTTTSSATTTSTSHFTTTTTLLEGNWLDRPLIATSSWGGALGWWDGDAWVSIEDDEPPAVEVGHQFQALGLGGSRLVATEAVESTCEWFPVEQFTVIFSGDRLELALPDEIYTQVAVSAPWDLVPHRVVELADLDAHAGFAADVLADLGLQVEDPIVTQALSVDLEGDGIWEKIIVAQDVEIQFDPVTEGYSVVFMRRVVDDEVKTSVVLSDVVHAGAQQMGSHSAVTGVGDLNGDGVMEVVLAGHSYEASGVGVYELAGEGLVKVLSTGCGV